MAKATNNKPFAVKGMRVTSPKGAALWCKATEPDYKFNAKGILSTSLVCDPTDPAVKAFIDKLEELQAQAYNETRETVGGAKAKQVKLRPIYTEEFDQDDNETGNIIFKFAMKNVDDKEPPYNKIKVVDAKTKPIKNVPLVGNGSIIRCVAYANPYYMATTKEVGISLLWESMQIVSLEEYNGGGSDFDEEDGYVADETATNNDAPFDVEDEGDDDIDGDDY